MIPFPRVSDVFISTNSRTAYKYVHLIESWTTDEPRRILQVQRVLHHAPSGTICPITGSESYQYPVVR